VGGFGPLIVRFFIVRDQHGASLRNIRRRVDVAVRPAATAITAEAMLHARSETATSRAWSELGRLQATKSCNCRSWMELDEAIL
jgi:hypothetical protein